MQESAKSAGGLLGPNDIAMIAQAHGPEILLCMQGFEPLSMFMCILEMKLHARAQELKERHRQVMQNMLMDMLRALATPNMDIRKKTLDIALDLINQHNIDEVMPWHPGKGIWIPYSSDVWAVLPVTYAGACSVSSTELHLSSSASSIFAVFWMVTLCMPPGRLAVVTRRQTMQMWMRQC